MRLRNFIGIIFVLVNTSTFAHAQKTPGKPIEPEVYSNQLLEETALGVFTTTLMCRNALTRRQYLDARNQYRDVLIWNDANRREAFRQSDSVEQMLGALGMGVEGEVCDGILTDSQVEFERISEAVGYNPN